MSLFSIKYNKGETTEDFKGEKKLIIPNSEVYTNLVTL